MDSRKTGAAAVSDDNTITVRGILSYVETNLPALPEKYRHQQQFPVAGSRGMDFPLVLRRQLWP